MLDWYMGRLVHIRKVGHAWVCVYVCVCVCVCVCVYLQLKALQRELVYTNLWFNYNVMGVVNVVMLYLVMITPWR